MPCISMNYKFLLNYSKVNILIAQKITLSPPPLATGRQAHPPPSEGEGWVGGIFILRG